MVHAGDRDDQPGPADTAIRHRRVPSRRLGDQIVVARPADGAPVVLDPTAAMVWTALDDWTTADRLDQVLGDAFPTVAAHEREAARAQILVALTDDDLLVRR